MPRKTLLIAAAMLALGTGAQAEETCPALHVVTAVDMTPTHPDAERVAIPMTIAGQPTRMLLDTGAYSSMLTPALVNGLKLHRNASGEVVRDVLGNETDQVAVVPELTLGKLKASNMRLFIMSDASDAAYDRRSMSNAGLEDGLGGVFGSDFMRPYDLDLDFTAMKMRLISQDHCPGRVIYWNPEAFAEVPFKLDDSGQVVFTMTLDGKDVRVMLDTGADGSSMMGYVAQQLFGITGPSGDDTVHRRRINGEDVPSYYEHRFQSLATEGLAIGNPSIVILPDVTGAKRGATQLFNDPDEARRRRTYDLVLGMATLRKLHVYVAYRERKLYLSPAAAAAAH